MTLTKKNNNKVVLGLSGGVDSTAAALLLKEKGFEVVGLYFDIFPERDDHGSEGKVRAERAAQQLNIKFIYKNVYEEFSEKIINNFCDEYKCGRTPNPCIICNPLIKFKSLIDTADKEDAYYIATGHYADTYHDEANDIWYIKKAANEKKDQSYMLYRLGQEVIKRLILPLNEVEDKDQVRVIARKNALSNSEAKDSQEICFIKQGDTYKDYLNRRGIKSEEGNFIDADGNVLGKHSGILNYTIGQRKGLGIALGKPVFVTRIDSTTKSVVLGDNKDLFKMEVISSDNIILGDRQDIKISEQEGLYAKIRYAAKPAEVSVELMDDGRIKTLFAEAQRAITPGQSIVFYQGDLVVGGGFID